MVVVRVPGAWEIPAALEALAAGRNLDALIALGAVVRGETPHFDYICAESSRGIAAVSERHRMAVGFGVLTCDTTAQAEERAGGKAGNKGWDAALAALEMADLLQRLQAK
jgi:6,7-dimethyl-8-ribityllumazine synthase